MKTTQKNGDNPPADALSRHLAAFRFAIETKPAPRIDAAPARAPRHEHTVRSVPVDPGTMSWHEIESPHPEESAANLAAILGGEVVTADHGGGGGYSTVLCRGLQVAGATAASKTTQGITVNLATPSRRARVDAWAMVVE